jgi:cation transport regulator ChaC
MTLTLPPGHSLLFGYGSLLSIRSLERTLGRTYDGPFLPCTITGWRRSWDAAMSNDIYFTDTEDGPMYPENILYLNIRRDSGTRLNGVVFMVDEAELANFDKRESIYDRVEISRELNPIVTNGPAFVYVCKPEHQLSEVGSPRQGAIRASYIDIVQTGLSAFDDEFRGAYLASTDRPPEHLIIRDRS